MTTNPILEADQPSATLEAALQYAGRGWRVIPLYGLAHGVCTCPKGTRCESPGKHPAVKAGKGFEKASTDRAQLERWFRRGDRNIGIATGRGLAVVDIDGPAGIKTLQDLVPPGSLPRTLCATTGRGMHLYYTVNGPAPTNSGAGLDVRGDGGMIVAPPSNHVSGKLYTWLGGPLAAMPSELLTFFRNRKGSKPDTKLNQSISSAFVPAYLRGLPSASMRLADRAAAGLDDPPASSDLLAVARTIPNDNVGWDEWNRLGMAFYASSDGSDDGLEAFCIWSEKSKKFDEQTCLSRWEAYDRSPPTEIGMGTLIYEARLAQADFKLPSISNAIGQHAQNNVNINGVTVALPASFIAGGIVFPDVERNGRPRPTAHNAEVAVGALGISVRRDIFHDRTEIEGRALQVGADNQLSDDAVLAVRRAILKQYGFDATSRHVNDALIWHAQKHAYHPIIDYLASLEWDHTPRLGGWLSAYLGAPDTALNGQFGKLILLAAVRRIRQPGAKFDEIMVLEGPEGQYKSTAIRILAGPDNFADQPILGLPDRMQQEALRGVWLYEIADLTGISRADVDKVKAFASRTEDRARPAYGHHRVDLKRQCVFFGTTNNKTYLQSQTGNRRWWPVECGVVNLSGLERDRDQLWAEAVARDKQGESVRLDPRYYATAADLQDARSEIDPWVSVLSEIEENRIASALIFEKYLRMTPDKLQMHHTKRLAFAMSKLKWYGPKLLWINGKAVRGYSK